MYMSTRWRESQEAPCPQRGIARGRACAVEVLPIWNSPYCDKNSPYPFDKLLLLFSDYITLKRLAVLEYCTSNVTLTCGNTPFIEVIERLSCLHQAKLNPSSGSVYTKAVLWTVYFSAPKIYSKVWPSSWRYLEEGLWKVIRSWGGAPIMRLVPF